MPNQYKERPRYWMTRTTSWFVLQAKLMAKQGKTLQEIIQRLNDLKHVLRDWSKNSADNPMTLPMMNLLSFGIARLSKNTSQSESLNGSKSRIHPIISELCGTELQFGFQQQRPNLRPLSSPP